MGEDRLEQVRRKVEAGERLTETELTLLETAARKQSGPTLRLAVAHAFINSGEDRQALLLLEALRRDFPTDLQVHLGHARALVGLERWTEADSSLKAALAINPGDPEALKVMALLALQRGEVRRARALVADVLRVDPFDGEARLVKEELESADLDSQSAEPMAMRDEFIRGLIERLVEKRMSHARRGKDLLLALSNGEVARIDLSSLYASYLDGKRSLAESLEVTAKELESLAAGVPKDKATLLASVLPVLRDAVFRDDAGGSLCREGPAELMVYYVFDDPALLRYVPRVALENSTATLDEVDSAAWANLSSRLGQPKPIRIERGLLSLSTESTGVWALSEGDGSDAARLLLPQQRALLGHALGAEPYQVCLGRRELALVCLEADVAAVARLRSVAAAPDGIAGHFRLRNDGLARAHE